MESGTIAIIIAGLALVFNVAVNVLGGGWSLSRRLTSLETGVLGVEEQIKKLADVLVKMADMNGDIKVLNARVTATEQDVRELRHGHGFVRESIEREYP